MPISRATPSPGNSRLLTPQAVPGAPELGVHHSSEYPPGRRPQSMGVLLRVCEPAPRHIAPVAGPPNVAPPPTTTPNPAPGLRLDERHSLRRSLYVAAMHCWVGWVQRRAGHAPQRCAELRRCQAGQRCVHWGDHFVSLFVSTGQPQPFCHVRLMATPLSLGGGWLIVAQEETADDASGRSCFLRIPSCWDVPGTRPGHVRGRLSQ
eukprot:gene23686-biopygen17844